MRQKSEGAKFKFEVWTDYKNLEYFIKTQKLNRKQAYQILYLLRFNLTLKHVPGTKMEQKWKKQIDLVEEQIRKQKQRKISNIKNQSKKNRFVVQQKQ